ncbi:MAG TPA: thioesterase family protein [Marmoricola sp.]|nr:thioesterase family protein [Marmoricola sp.]
MGDLAADTAVRPTGSTTFAVTLDPSWEIWGPQGGYVAACALRAAGAASRHAFPVSLSCHYLGVASWGEAELRVATRKEGRSAAAYRVEMTQHGRPILDAMVWTADAVEGLEYDDTEMPVVPAPEDVRLVEELLPAGDWPPYPFWQNLQYKLPGVTWPPDGPDEAIWRPWLRFVPPPVGDDVWVDAARAVILIDLASWPAVQSRHGWQQPEYVAPTLDLNVAFHGPALGQDWLLCDSAAPLSTRGLFGWNARIWSSDGTLHASGGGQCRYRRLPD